MVYDLNIYGTEEDSVLKIVFFRFAAEDMKSGRKRDRCLRVFLRREGPLRYIHYFEEKRI